MRAKKANTTSTLQKTDFTGSIVSSTGASDADFIIKKDVQIVPKVSEILTILKQTNELYAKNAEDEEVLNAMRADLSNKFLYLYEKAQIGVERGSALHIEAANKVLNSLVDLHGLKRAVVQREEKIITDIVLKWDSGGGN